MIQPVRAFWRGLGFSSQDPRVTPAPGNSVHCPGFHRHLHVCVHTIPQNKHN